MFSDFAFNIFQKSIEAYHIKDDVYQEFTNPYPTDKVEHLLYRKNWIDTVQWHYEDIIRDPDIDPVAALDLKRKIDASNQDRTDLVEYIDGYFLNKYQSVQVNDNATINTEEVNRTDASQEHIAKCSAKLDVLLEQKKDLSTAIDQLLFDIEAGDKYMKVYKQMKMYNDDELNPVLRGQKG